MKTSPSSFLYLLLVMIMMAACRSHTTNIPQIEKQAFNDYWNQGKAEISTFKLMQSLDGSQHHGSVVMVFVTEDMSRKRGTKIDEPQKHSSDAVKVLKCTMHKEFITGINQYNMMSSVFTPLDHGQDVHSLKLVASTQEWSGQTFLQANWRDFRYDIHQYSYLDKEGDTEVKLVNTWLEDEIWNKIRIAPDNLPIGKIKIIPAAFYLRLSHTPIKDYDAVATLKEENGFYTYSIQYSDLKRTMEISFQKSFPHQLMGWKETYAEGQSTTATLSKTLLSDYWNHNLPGDESLRDTLQLGR